MYKVILILLFVLFVSKLKANENKYQYWLDFYNLTSSEFKLTESKKLDILNFKEYEISDFKNSIFNSFFFYSPDSLYFVDLFSYHLQLEHIENKLISFGGEVDTKVQLIKVDEKKSFTILFCGSINVIEYCYWVSNFKFIILGFEQDDNNLYTPVKYEYDINENTIKIYRINDKIEINEFFNIMEILKRVQFINQD